MMKKILLLLNIWAVALVLAAAPEGSFNWSEAREISKDIRHAELTLTEPRPLKIHALKIDLSNPHLKLVTTGRAENYGKPMPDCPQFNIVTKRQRTLDFVQEMRRKGLNMVLAVNAAPWKPWEKPFNHQYADKIGYAVADGVVVSLPEERPVPALIQSSNGAVSMRTVAPGEQPKDVRLAVSGFEFILRDGAIVTKEKNRLEPRTFYGLDKAGTMLYLVTVDGRQEGYSEGMTLQEGAEYLRHFGAHDAINMDGGGSTSMVIFNPAKGSAELVNLPPGKELPRFSRSVANNLGVYYAKPGPAIKPQVVKAP